MATDENDQGEVDRFLEIINTVDIVVNAAKAFTEPGISLETQKQACDIIANHIDREGRALFYAYVLINPELNPLANDLQVDSLWQSLHPSTKRFWKQETDEVWRSASMRNERGIKQFALKDDGDPAKMYRRHVVAICQNAKKDDLGDWVAGQRQWASDWVIAEVLEIGDGIKRWTTLDRRDKNTIWGRVERAFGQDEYEDEGAEKLFRYWALLAKGVNSENEEQALDEVDEAWSGMEETKYWREAIREMRKWLNLRERHLAAMRHFGIAGDEFGHQDEAKKAL